MGHEVLGEVGYSAGLSFDPRDCCPTWTTRISEKVADAFTWIKSFEASYGEGNVPLTWCCPVEWNLQCGTLKSRGIRS
jgi:hypothetical protein